MLRKASRRAGDYVLLYVVGPFIAEWWCSLFTTGFGLTLYLAGPGALGVHGSFDGPLSEVFAEITPVFGLCLTLAGLLSFDALHKGRRWQFLSANLFAMFAMLWVMVFYLTALPLPLHAVWVYFSHATLQALIFVRTRHRLVAFWHERGPLR